MLNKIEKAVERYNLFQKGDSIMVALSGGADSTALLHALVQLGEKYSLNVTAAHLNHKLRGDESDRDEQFVRKMCDELGVELVCESADITSLAKKGEGIEECARRVRYDFLQRNAKGKIATAHSADDNIETVIFNLTRGSGIKGGCGIPPVRDNIIRPLIMCSRAEIEEYCQKNGLSFVTDSSNLTDDYTRNRIRHNVIPVLKEINSAAGDSFYRFTSVMNDVNDLLDDLAFDALEMAKSDKGYDADRLANLHISVLTRAVGIILNENDSMSDSEHIGSVVKLIKDKKGKCQLNGGLFAEVKGNRLTIFGKETKKNTVTPCYDFVNKSVTFGEISLQSELVSADKVNNLLAKNLIDYDKIEGEPVLRARKSGDSIRLKKRPRKSVKKLFCELKIDLEKRDNLPILADEKGVIWIYDVGPDERVAVDEKSKNILKISGVVEK
ncbi:MAG: tRNA lysidine(34) synthetase TilS [Clostridia bacterium]|nr:tRNA lysidine(34) synthetase TilS [Clostridia bacterium]